MPVIVTRRSGSCTSCGGAITKGEYALYSRETGTQHPECAGQEALRVNQKPGKCAACGRDVPGGEGRLEHQERQDGDRWTRTWIVFCRGGCGTG